MKKSDIYFIVAMILLAPHINAVIAVIFAILYGLLYILKERQ